MFELSLKLLSVKGFQFEELESNKDHLEKPSGRYVPKEALNYGIA